MVTCDAAPCWLTGTLARLTGRGCIIFVEELIRVWLNSVSSGGLYHTSEGVRFLTFLLLFRLVRQLFLADFHRFNQPKFFLKTFELEVQHSNEPFRLKGCKRGGSSVVEPGLIKAAQAGDGDALDYSIARD